MATYVLVHGAWHTGDHLADVAAPIKAAGHTVHTPTLAGNRPGDAKTAGLDDAIGSLVDYFDQHGISDAVVMGHSYGGMVITGVAEVVPERIRRLVYFDAFLPRDGECAMSIGRTEGPEALCSREAADRVMGNPVVNGAIRPGWVPDDAPIPRDVPHPVGTLVERIRLAGEPGRGRPAAYIITRETSGGPDGFNVPAERAEALGWPVVEYIGDHVPYRQDPGGIARLFVSFEGGA